MDEYRGILRPGAVDTRFTIERIATSPDLAAYVAWFWIVRWSLDAPYTQETLPYPCVNMVVGTHQPGLFGPQRRRFVAELEGTGSVVGTKFTPAGFYAFHRRSLVELVDRSLPIKTGIRDGARLETKLADASDDRERIATIEAFLRHLEPAHDPAIAEVNAIVELARTDLAIARVSDLATRSGVAARTLERMFREYVGLAPKWIIRRFRVHEAAEVAARGERVDWSRLVHELGYYDQAHFIREFKEQIGCTPARYAAECARQIGS
jgi:AraC-like DNA-binding protein